MYNIFIPGNTGLMCAHRNARRLTHYFRFGVTLMLTLLRDVGSFRSGGSEMIDLLIEGSTVGRLTRPGELRGNPLISSEIDSAGLYALPGFVDQHIHITGAGGEEGYISRTAELQAAEILRAGVTTLVGLLGADGLTRSLENLLAKARALEAEGLTAYIYSGSYAVPPVTFTGLLARDMLLVEKVVGAGEIAVSDHRSSNPDGQVLRAIGSEAHLGALLTGKAGVVHLHIGDGKSGLSPLLDALEYSDLPKEQFIPTHVNRNERLFNEAVRYALNGGYIDLTAGEQDGIAVPRAVAVLADEGVGLSQVTVSSDAGGSTPSGGVTRAAALFEDFKEIIKQSVLPPEEAVRLFSENPAKRLRLYPGKGTLLPGSDADILLTDKDLNVRKVFCKGRLLLDAG
jgi:beta-aspartyl-dipeptidase (metallo-type)